MWTRYRKKKTASRAPARESNSMKRTIMAQTRACTTQFAPAPALHRETRLMPFSAARNARNTILNRGAFCASVRLWNVRTGCFVFFFCMNERRCWCKFALEDNFFVECILFSGVAKIRNFSFIYI